MGWLLFVLAALLVVGLLALAMPTVFGPVLGGLAPLLVVLALIGFGGVWWRRSRSRVDAEVTDDNEPARREELRGEDERVET